MDEKLYQEAAPHDETCLQGHVVLQKEVTSAQRHQEIQSWARQFGKAAAVTVFVMARLASAAGQAVAAAERKRKMEAAAVTIQALTRGNRDRRWVQQLLWKMEAAAVKIQSLTRGHRDRRRVQTLLDELWDGPLAHLAHPRTGQTPLNLIQAAQIEHSSDYQQKLIGMLAIGTGECLILHDNHAKWNMM